MSVNEKNNFKNLKTDKPEKSSKFKVYYGNTNDDIVELMKGNIPEKDQQKIMEFLNSVDPKSNEGTNDATVATMTGHNAINDGENNKQIILIKTASSTILVPILANSDMKFNMSFDVSLLGEKECTERDQNVEDGNLSTYSVNSQDGSINIETNITDNEGLVPIILIPHECDGNNNESSISKIIDYLKLAFPNSIDVVQLEQITDANITIQAINIK
jgi:hypothetical protein